MHANFVRPVTVRINQMKKRQQFCVATAKQDGTKLLFLSVCDAAKSVGVFSTNICKAMFGKYSHTGGYFWRVASDAEVQTIFGRIREDVAEKSWDQIIAALDKYKEHHLYEAMVEQARLNREYALALSSWRAAPNL